MPLYRQLTAAYSCLPLPKPQLFRAFLLGSSYAGAKARYGYLRTTLMAFQQPQRSVALFNFDLLQQFTSQVVNSQAASYSMAPIERNHLV